MNADENRSGWLGRVIGSALGIVALGVCVSALPAMAQQQGGQGLQSGQGSQSNQASSGTGASNSTNAQQPVSLNAVSVVGTRIRSTAVAQPRPIAILTAKQIEATGLVNVGQILQQITSSGTTTSKNMDVRGNGTTTLSLRNLGANRTLVLVNGKRWIMGLSGSVDLDQIPTSVIDTIQILKDGASAIYGSDAIAGVINIITKKQFDGAQASAYVGYDNYSGRWDGQTQQFSYLMGAGNDKGNILFGVEYNQNDGINACERALSCPPIFNTPLGSSIGPQGRYQFYPPSDSPLYSNAQLCPPLNGRPFCDLTTKKGTSGASISDYRPYDSLTDAYNYSQLYDLVAPNQATNLYIQGTWNLNPNLSFHSTGMYNHHFHNQHFSPRNIAIGGGDPQGSFISATNPYNPFGFDLNGNVSAPSPGVAQLITASMQPLNGGFRDYDSDTYTYYYNGGFDGTFNLGTRNFIWNADYVFGRELEWSHVEKGTYNNARLDTALGPISNCGPGTPNPDCVPFNYFSSALETEAMFAYIRAPSTSDTNETLRDYEFNLSSSDLADLPGGPLGFNVGYEYRQLAGDSHPDSLSVANGQSSPGTSGMYSVKSVYGELDVPLLANVPLVKEMDIDLAVRHSKFSTFGSNTSRQVGFKWQPNDQLLLRASWAQGFRAPDITELFSPQRREIPTGNDPCDSYELPSEPAYVTANCRAHGVPPTYAQPNEGELDSGVFTGGNPNVQPESSESRSYGFVFNPDLLPGFDFEADYFKINVNNLISTFGAFNTLNACYYQNIQSFCDAIIRLPNGQLKQLLDINVNVGNLFTSGIDVAASYAFTTGIGSFHVKFSSTFTRNYDLSIPTATGGTKTFHEVGWAIGTTYQAYPKNKSILNVVWNSGNWSALWRLRYISSMLEDCTRAVQFGVCTDPKLDHLLYTGGIMVPTNHLGATTYNDASVSYAMDAINSTLTLGVNNLFGKEPPNSFTASNDSFIQTVYDFPGSRFVYFRITTNF